MLIPKKSKYRRQMRGKNRGIATRGVDVSFGEYGLKAVASGMFSSRQLESARKAIMHFTKRGGKLWVRVFPSKPMTRKGEGRMGSGKGAVDHYVAVIKPGMILFEMSGVTETIANEAFKRASDKIPFKTIFISNEN